MSMNKKESVDFLKSLFEFDSIEQEIEVKAHTLAGKFLYQVEKSLEQKKMSNKDLAKKIGVSSSYLSQLFCSERLINFKTLAKIEKALEIKFEVGLKQDIAKELKKFKEVNFSKFSIKTSKETELVA